MSLLRPDARTASRLLAVTLGAFLTVGLLVGPVGRAVASDVSPPTPTAGATTWSMQPANGDGADGRVSLRHEVEPGQSVEEHVALTNFSDRPARFLVYASDGVTAADGSFDILASTDRPVDGGSWIVWGDVPGASKDDQGRLALDVAPASVVILPLSIAIPGDAAPGDHPAGIVAELAHSGSGVTVASRVGVRAHLRVAGEVTARLTPEIVDVRWEPSWNPLAPGTLRVTYRVENDGNIRLGATAIARVSGPFGMLATEAAPVEIAEVLPGASTEFTAELSFAPLFHASVGVGVTPKMVGQDRPAALSEATAEASVWTVPFVQLLLVLLIAAGVWAWRRRRRRGAQDTQAKIDAAVAAALSERETSTAATHDALTREVGAPGGTEAAVDEEPSRAE